MNTFFNDIKFAARQLQKNLGFTVIAVLTLGLGIGATTTLFSVFKAWVFDPFPYPEADRIVHVWSNIDKDGEGPLSPGDYCDIRDQNKCFASIGAYTLGRVDLGGDKPESIYAVHGTAGLLPVFGKQPILGRFLDEADEENANAAPVAVISHRLWQRLFTGDQDVLGKTLRLNQQNTAVVGVMPADFEFHTARQGGRSYDIWMPRQIRSQNRGAQSLLCMARLKPEVSFDAARAAIKIIGARLATDYPETNQGKPLALRSHHKEITRHSQSGMGLLFATVGLLLLIACANVASMLLAHGAKRQAEFSLRQALGARRSDMFRLLLSESFLVAFFGNACGILIAILGLAFVKRFIPATAVIASVRDGLQLEGSILLFSMGLAILTAFLFGLLPAFSAAQSKVMRSMNETGRSHAGSRARQRFLRTLVVGQIALVLTIANGAILLSQSYVNVMQINQPIRSDQVLTASIQLRGERYKEAPARQQFWEKLTTKVGALAGVRSAAINTNMPLEGSFSCFISRHEKPFDRSIIRSQPLAEISYVSSDYLTSMGIPLLHGRAPEARDNEGQFKGVAVNRTLANTLWPGQDPIGKLLKPFIPNPFFEARVVGVVEDVRQWGAEVPALPQIYLPFASGRMHGSTLVVRTPTSTPTATMVPSLRQALSQIDPDLLLVNVRTMKQVVDQSTSGRRFYTFSTNAFMSIALIIAIVGIYGTLSYTLTQQKREIAVRQAVGALPHHILTHIMKQTGTWLILGLTLGLGGTVALSIFLRSLVYNISALHPTSLLVGAGFITLIVCLACFAPIRRIVKTDPVEALRYE
ncbi:ABC transporter permease [Planctomycetota bacterium]